MLDQEQALADVEQAKLDAKQAEEDKTQATLDGKQAVIDAKDAQLNLNDAMKEANPSGLQQWADKLNILTPILSAVVGVMGLVTAAQWAWNAAQLASPTTWIILAIVGLIAVIVLIATKTTWFQDLWKATWNGIKTAAKAVGDWFTNTLAPAFGRAWQWIKDKAAGVWDWMKALPGKFRDAFAKVNGYISAPFRAAFNTVSDAWNNTVGRLNWTVPSWVPHYGGNTVSAPRLPKFHTGGVVPGSPGQEVPIMALAGERVSRPGQGGGETLQVVVKLDSGVLIEGIARAVRRQGGDVQFVLGGANV